MGSPLQPIERKVLSEGYLPSPFDRYRGQRVLNGSVLGKIALVLQHDPELRHCLNPPLRVVGDRGSVNQAGQPLRVSRLGDDLDSLCLGVYPGWLVGQHVPQDLSEAVHVGERAGLRPLPLWGRPPGRVGARRQGHPRAGGDLLGEAEVDQYDPPLRMCHDVVRLDVPVVEGRV